MKLKTVYVVCSSYNYEGESVEAVYSTEAKAKKHPNVNYAGEIVIHKIKVNKPIKSK